MANPVSKYRVPVDTSIVFSYIFFILSFFFFNNMNKLRTFDSHQYFDTVMIWLLIIKLITEPLLNWKSFEIFNCPLTLVNYVPLGQKEVRDYNKILTFFLVDSKSNIFFLSEATESHS